MSGHKKRRALEALQNRRELVRRFAERKVEGKPLCVFLDEMEYKSWMHIKFKESRISLENHGQELLCRKNRAIDAGNECFIRVRSLQFEVNLDVLRCFRQLDYKWSDLYFSAVFKPRLEFGIGTPVYSPHFIAEYFSKLPIQPEQAETSV